VWRKLKNSGCPTKRSQLQSPIFGGLYFSRFEKGETEFSSSDPRHKYYDFGFFVTLKRISKDQEFNSTFESKRRLQGSGMNSLLMASRASSRTGWAGWYGSLRTRENMHTNKREVEGSCFLNEEIGGDGEFLYPLEIWSPLFPFRILHEIFGHLLVCSFCAEMITQAKGDGLFTEQMMLNPRLSELQRSPPSLSVWTPATCIGVSDFPFTTQSYRQGVSKIPRPR
jgi:hypothetical protein